MKKEYDFSKGVRGKYAKRVAVGTPKSATCPKCGKRAGAYKGYDGCFLCDADKGGCGLAFGLRELVKCNKFDVVKALKKAYRLGYDKGWEAGCDEYERLAVILAKRMVKNKKVKK